MVNQVCFQVFGCDAAVLAAADHGQLELNVMMPVIAWNILHALRIMTSAMRVLDARCVSGIAADEARCRELLDRSTAVATALTAFFGTGQVSFTLDSRVTGTTRAYDRFHDAVKDVDWARVLAGFHFRNSDQEGSALGRRVGRYVTDHLFNRSAEAAGWRVR